MSVALSDQGQTELTITQSRLYNSPTFLICHNPLPDGDGFGSYLSLLF
jgi:hypothetical protein